MSSLDHWQPVMSSRRLKGKPLAVGLAEQEIVLFRTAAGGLGALADRCPHRGMRLSHGRVENDRLTCPYHGWNYDAQGKGASPGNPNFSVCATSFETAEKYGMIWVKSRRTPSEIPTLDADGFYHVHTLCKTVRAPVEVLLDNFTEVEHTSTAHLLFGYAQEKMDEVTLETEVTDEGVRSLCSGPQKKLFWFVEPFIKVHTGDRFIVDFTTYFAPLHARYEMSWEDPVSGAQRPLRLKEAAFFCKLNEQESLLVAFYFSTLKPSGALGLNRLISPVVRKVIDYEFELDRRLIENVTHAGAQLQGCRLGRFDKALVAQRRHLTKSAQAPGPRPNGEGSAD
jgi:vanillate O-demethylase monooxygenase subunit